MDSNLDRLARETAQALVRYDLETVGRPYMEHEEMVPREDGDWVRYDSVMCAVRARFAGIVEDAVEFGGDNVFWVNVSFDVPEDRWQVCCSKPKSTCATSSGKRARLDTLLLAFTRAPLGIISTSATTGTNTRQTKGNVCLDTNGSTVC